MDIKVVNDFNFEVLLKCFGDDIYDIEPKALRYHISKELEEEHLGASINNEESAYKTFKNIPAEVYKDYIISGDLQQISCKLISR